ncbi:hypothetical protein [Tsukamurella ocularis]|uniref:hypothetical protein n=1 Tax=Tsukamurella ocularis TaxID=1970234 RepID=UPI002166F6AD|nr:hypothetical protein [Tsukamurella ocularis]MCS3779356.1 hypothetical protein [Tsukamurella ocularis]MCS3789914.1 hypothetical protein [Tsukamurella ocularis]
MTATVNESAEQRANADYELTGDTPESRRLSAEILVKLDRQEGKTPDQWVLDVAEGRLPA